MPSVVSVDRPAPAIAPAQRAPARPDALGQRLAQAVAQRPERLDETFEATAGAAFGVDLSPVRLVADSAVPAYLGAQALARGTEIHLAPGAPAPGSAAGERLLAHEIAHVIQQHHRTVAPTTVFGGVPLSTDRGLERAADAAADRFVRGEPAALAPIPVLGVTTGAPVAQLYPPANVEEANRELDEVEGQLFGPGRSVTWRTGHSLRRPREYPIALDNPRAGGLRSLLEAVRTGIVGATGIDVERARDLIDLWLKLKEWKDCDFRSQGGFGFGHVPSAYFLPPGPLQTDLGYNPFAPELHGVPMANIRQDSTLERLGDDLVVRKRKADELADTRERSNAYGRPSKRRRVHDEPTFGPEIFLGESATITARRVGLWATQKRGRTATAGALAGTGRVWGDQQQALGMSAQDAVLSANHAAGLGLDGEIPYQWLHLFAFSIGGLDGHDPQDPRNFVVGSAHANYHHQIYESAAKTLARQHGVTVSCCPIEPVSEQWRIYRKLRYSFCLSGGIPFPWQSVIRDIDLLATTPVHAGDAAGLKEQLLASLGFPSERYLAAFEEHFRAASASWPTTRLQPLTDELSPFVAEDGDEDDEQMQWALTDSVQEIARRHGVSARFRVGHASGQDRNCSILSVFAAAGVELDCDQAQEYRRELERDLGQQLEGDIDLADQGGLPAALLLGYLERDYGERRALWVLRPTSADSHAHHLLAGESESPAIHIFYASGHFSPAWPGGSG